LSSFLQALVPSSSGAWLQAALVRSFVTLDQQFAAVSQGTYVGTTAVVLLLGRTRLWVAHCGEYRAHGTCSSSTHVAAMSAAGTAGQEQQHKQRRRHQQQKHHRHVLALAVTLLSGPDTYCHTLCCRI
jgi:serine/threonine protein phosphatase PrpC